MNRPNRPALVVLLLIVSLLVPAAMQGQGSAAKLLAELESGDGTRCMNAGNATSEHQEHYQAMAAELAPGLLRLVESNGACSGSALSAMLNLGSGIAAGAPADRTVPLLIGFIEGGMKVEFGEPVHRATSAMLILGNTYADTAGPAVPVIERWLRERSDYSDRRYAVMVLGEIGDGAVSAVPALLEIFTVAGDSDDDGAYERESLRLDAARALANIPAAAAQSSPALAKALRSEDYALSGAAGDALATLGAGAVPALMPLLKPGEEEDVRQRALNAFGRMGVGAGAASPAIAAVLDDENWNLRFAAAEALREIGPTADGVAALAQLVEKSGDDDAAVEAARLLGGYGSAARAALPTLRRVAARDQRKQWSPRTDAATEAIQAIE